MAPTKKTSGTPTVSTRTRAGVQKQTTALAKNSTVSSAKKPMAAFPKKTTAKPPIASATANPERSSGEVLAEGSIRPSGSKNELFEGSDFEEERSEQTNGVHEPALFEGSDFEDEEETKKTNPTEVETIEIETISRMVDNRERMVNIIGTIIGIDDVYETKTRGPVLNLLLGDEDGRSIKISIWRDKIKAFKSQGPKFFDCFEFKSLRLRKTAKGDQKFNPGTTEYELSVENKSTIRKLQNADKMKIKYLKVDELETCKLRFVSIRGTVDSIEKKVTANGQERMEVMLKQPKGQIKIMFWAAVQKKAINLKVGSKTIMIGCKMNKYKDEIQLVITDFTEVINN